MDAKVLEPYQFRMQYSSKGFYVREARIIQFGPWPDRIIYPPREESKGNEKLYDSNWNNRSKMNAI